MKKLLLLFPLLVCLSSFAGAFTLYDNLTSYYDFEQAVSGVLVDKMNRTNSSYDVASGLVEGINNNAWSFVKATGVDRVLIPLDYSNSTAVTVAYWVKPTTLNDNNYFMIMSNTDHCMAVHSDARGGFTFRVGNGGATTEFNLDTEVNLEVGTWHHIVWRYIGSGKPLVGFIDGTKYTDDQNAEGISEFINVSIGATRSNFYHMDGVIDEVMIYNRSIGDDEVAALYNDGTGVFLSGKFVDSPPSYISFDNNGSANAFSGSVINWSIVLADNAYLSHYIFAHNDTGTLTNGSLTAISGDSVSIDELVTITSFEHNYICGQFWINDSTNNINQTKLTDSGACFIVGNQTPQWSGDSTNATFTAGYIEFNITLTDDSELDFFAFSWNESGSWVNSTWTAVGSSSVVAITDIAASSMVNGTLGWMYHFNDSTGKRNQTDIFTLIIDKGGPEIVNFTVVGTNISGATFYVNLTSRDQFSNISSWIVSINQTGSWVNTSANVTWDSSGNWFIAVYSAVITAVKDTVVGILGYVADVAGNVGQTVTTLITIGNAPPSATNFTFPTAPIYSTTTNITINWENATDADNDLLYYRLWFGTTSPPTSLYQNRSALAEFCYQENATVATSCGGLSTGVYGS